MASWCRSVVQVLGLETDVAQFVGFLGPNDYDRDEDDPDGPLTEIAEVGLLQRALGRVEYELVTKWQPPLAELTDLSRQFPRLTLQVNWEQHGDALFGCAIIADGNKNVLELDGNISNFSTLASLTET